MRAVFVHGAMLRLATHVAIGMCGDLKEGIELAVGAPRDPDADGTLPRFSDGLLAVEITPEEVAAFTAAEDALHAKGSP